jgi:hypothetical protein
VPAAQYAFDVRRVFFERSFRDDYGNFVVAKRRSGTGLDGGIIFADQRLNFVGDNLNFPPDAGTRKEPDRRVRIELRRSAAAANRGTLGRAI